MTQDLEVNHLMQSIGQKSLKILEDLKTAPPHLPDLLEKYIDLIQNVQTLIELYIKNPEAFWQMQINYMQDAMNLAQETFSQWMEGKTPELKDKRFANEEWANNPFFNFLGQHYLLAAKHLNTLMENLEYSDKKEAKRMQFFTKQYLDALSPSNFLYTNPQLMAETIQSQGKNLLHGLNNLLTDMETGSSNLIIKMTDTKAFTIGENIATTKGKVIFRNELMELIQYQPQTEKVKTQPLLMIPPWINKYYILDLSQENSLVHWLVEQGITVFMISWVNPDANHANISFYDYLHLGPETALEVIQKQLKVKKINTLGFCIGGTLLATLLAYHKAKNLSVINSATFLASLLDFSEPGDISVFLDEQQIEKIESMMEKKGYLAGEFMASSFNSLRANDLIWSFFIKNYLQGKQPVPFDLLYWNADSTNMPATMHSQYLRWMYLHNDLIKPGKIRLNKVAIDIRKIDCPCFFVSTEKDHIAPWKTVYLGFKLMNGPKQFLLGGSGHIAGIINPPSAKKYQYHSNKEAPKTAEEWLEKATRHEGSWWPEWLDWLKKHSGRYRAAPDLNTLPYPPLYKAPGQYVLKKS